MPKGGARPGAGRPRKPLADHLLRGTYRRDRHGPLPSNVVPMPAPQSGGWQPTQIEDLQTEINYHTWVRQQEAEKVPR